MSTPFGRKTDPLTGRTIDFDHIYEDVLGPALAASGLTPQRGHELEHGAIFQASLLEAIASSEVMVADITTSNANVMYELGLRHALRPGVTLLVMATGSAVPFNINLSRILPYEIGADGRVTLESALRLREQLGRLLREGFERATPDSPVYAFLPGLEVRLPERLAQARRRSDVRGVATLSGLRSLGPGSVGDQKVALRAAEERLHQEGVTDAREYLVVLRGYQDLSAWDDLVRVAEEAPQSVEHVPEVRQLVALALNRRGGERDRERAITMMWDLVRDGGGDAETFVILGRLYKDRHEMSRAEGDAAAAQRDLRDAIDAYGRAFELAPNDTYAGLNLVTLLVQDGSSAAHETLRKVLPRVRSAAQARLDDGAAGYWEFATALHLAVVAGDWDDARHMATRARAAAPSPWMIDSTALELEGLAATLDPSLHYGLRQMVDVLRAETAMERDHA